MQHSSGSHVRVVSPHGVDLAPLLERAGATVVTRDGALMVTGMEAPRIAALAAEHRIEIQELSLHRASLEEAFMELTQHSVEYQGGAPDVAAATQTAQVLAGTGTRS